MMPGPFELIIILFLIIYPLTIYYFANKMNDKFQLKNPNSKRFIWGYFIGIGSITTSILMFSIDLLQIYNLGGEFDWNVQYIIVNIFIMVIGVTIGYLVINRNKIALVVLTVLSINPIIWVINFFYLKNRWDELS
jgi:hypothetical protein